MEKSKMKIATISLLLATVMTGLNTTIISTILPSINSDLSSIKQTGFILCSFLVSCAIATTFWATISDHFGEKRAFQLSLGTFLLGACIETFSINWQMIVVAGMIKGIGAGGMIGLPFVIYAFIYKDPIQRSRVFSWVTAFFSLSAIIGPLIGGWFVDNLNWHWACSVNIPLGIISLILFSVTYNDEPRSLVDSKIDKVGIALLSLGIIALLVGIQVVSTPHNAICGIVLLLLSLLLFVWLVKYESSVTDPVIPERLFKEGNVFTYYIIFFLIYAEFFGFNIYVPMWAQSVLGCSATKSGLTLLPGAVTNFLGATIASKLIEHWSIKKASRLALIFFVITTLILALIPFSSSIYTLLIANIFQGFGLGMIFTILQLAVQEESDPKDTAIATSFSLLVRMLGQSVFASVFSVLANVSSAVYFGKESVKIPGKMIGWVAHNQLRLVPEKFIQPIRMSIFYGIHNIMILLLAIVLLAVIFNEVFVKHTRV